MRVKLTEKLVEAPGTKSFFFKPEKVINFLPGQYYYYTLPNLDFPDQRGNTRHFTVSSSPTEGNFLRLTTRIREESGYKKTLDNLPIGATLEVDGPTGTFILDELTIQPSSHLTSHVFLAGGIGITPFRSFIKYSIDKQSLAKSEFGKRLKTPMYLIYSNSDSNFVFGKEIKTLLKNNASFIDTSVSGHLDKLKIAKLIENWGLKTENCSFWLVGPPAFNDAMELVLDKMKIDSNKIFSEKFTGY